MKIHELLEDERADLERQLQQRRQELKDYEDRERALKFLDQEIADTTPQNLPVTPPDVDTVLAPVAPRVQRDIQQNPQNYNWGTATPRDPNLIKRPAQPLDQLKWREPRGEFTDSEEPDRTSPNVPQMARGGATEA